MGKLLWLESNNARIYKMVLRIGTISCNRSSIVNYNELGKSISVRARTFVALFELCDVRTYGFNDSRCIITKNQWRLEV